MNWNATDTNRIPARNGSDADRHDPTVADATSAVSDDAQVIERTLPAPQTPGVRDRVRANVERATGATRGYVSRSPLSATAMAAAGGAALTAAMLLLGARARPQLSPVHAGLRRLRAAIR